MPQSCRLDLPLPPSVNAAYANVAGRGRVATKALKEWKEAAGWELKTQPRKQFAGPFRVRVLVPEAMRGDVDNRTKAAIDLLVSHSITPDDRFAQAVSSERSAEVMPGRCIVIVEAAGGPRG